MEALQRLHNRGSISTGYEIANSCKFEDDNDEWLYRTNASGTNAKTWTVSWWFKQTELASVRSSYIEHWQGGGYGEATRAGIDQYDRLWIDVGGGDGNTGTLFRSLSTARLRDISAWYHVVIACDSTQSTEANRLKVWLNGVEVTAWDQKQYHTLNFGSALAGFGGIQMKWGSADATYHGYSGYLAECNYLDGVTATQNDFGEFDDDSGIWKPKAYTGSYGTNGTYLDFADASDLGDDESGNGNDYTETNITAADQATDTPTNNFCTWNTIPYYNTNYSFANGATEVVRASGTGWTTAYSSIGANKGKWYAEFQVLTSGNYLMNGNVPLAKIQSVYATQFYLGSDASAGAGAGYYSSGTTGNDAIYHDAGFTSSGVTTSAGDIISVAMDCDNNKIHFAVNGTYTNSSNPATNTNGFNMTDDYQFFAHSTLTGDQVFKNNFGGFTTISISSAASDANGYGTFEYAPPSGFYALNTKNLAEYG